MGLAEHVADWAPGPVEETDRIGAWSAHAFADLLDQPSPVDAAGVLPPLWHRFAFLERAAQHELGEDGHVRESHFLPPIPDRRRMFAGGRLEWHAPVRIGDDVVRRTAIGSMTPKSGRSGEMLFVTLRHEFRCDGRLLLSEEEDLVYRQQKPGEGRRVTAPVAAEAGPHTAGGPWTARLEPDEVMLFRFSALTYNAHRIHHDLPYTTGVEGFPGLVVHGPLLALLLLELPRRHAPDRTVRSFEYRLRAPAFAGTPILAAGGPSAADSAGTAEDTADLAAGTADGPPSITGTVGFA
ncbi:MaoC family dehydratase N-terminal domain-containing protein [Pseudonocardia sp. N23]|uniref:FAS1-like dehydratase domain-containing protein n=1 Tax=Pseudonocardia sp. N23 TaxID=1987376 RepID=UPI000BFB6DF6|nr:MaoC family dehydratase N-terminal domain-containing protein [Pseudonocardia sp. N23]GAY10842.1 hypothetical protein TOK_5204 [Pseudonocardia sp. N23]